MVEAKGHHESYKVRQENDVNLYVIIIVKLVAFRLPREDSLVFFTDLRENQATMTRVKYLI